MKIESHIGRENERLGSFYVAGHLEMFVQYGAKWCEALLLPTSTLRAPKVERRPSNANLYCWALSKDFRKVFVFYFLNRSNCFQNQLRALSLLNMSSRIDHLLTVFLKFLEIARTVRKIEFS